MPNRVQILKLVPFRMYREIYTKFCYFQIFSLTSSGQDAFGKREKAEETRWARRFVRI